MRKPLSSGLLAIGLGACGHVPFSTMWALRNFDAGNADPGLLRAAIRLLDAIQPQPSGVKLEVGWWREGEEDNKRNVKFALQEAASPADTAPLARERRPGTRIFVYRVDPSDIPGIRALQAEVREEKRRNPGKTHGTFGIGTDACRRGELPNGPVLITTFLRTDTERGYLTLLNDVDLRTVATKEKSFDELVPPCEKFPNRVDAPKADR